MAAPAATWGSCRAPDHDHGSPRAAGENFDVELDITHAVRAASDDSKQVILKLVAVDITGNDVKGSDVRLDEIELIVE